MCLSVREALHLACRPGAVGGLRQNRPMPTQLTFGLGRSQGDWLTLQRRSDNPVSATGGPLPQVIIPLEGFVAEQGIEVEILRLAFDMKIRNLLLGQGEVGPYTYLRTKAHYIPATATCPHTALPHLLCPEPQQGPITLTLAFRGLLRYRHSFQQRAHELGEPGVWHIESTGDQALLELDIQVGRSDWYEQVAAKLGIGGYLLTPLYLPVGVKAWHATLRHLDKAAEALAQGNPPGVFAACRAAIDALPGDKTAIFAAMPEGKKRDEIDTLTKSIGKYIHSGRHVVPNAGGDQAGEFPVDMLDAVFVYNITKLLLSHVASLTLTP